MRSPSLAHHRSAARVSRSAGPVSMNGRCFTRQPSAAARMCPPSSRPSPEPPAVRAVRYLPAPRWRLTPMRHFSTVEVTCPRPEVALATLNRPEMLNAMNEQMIGEIEQLCREVEATPQIRVLVLAGAGRAFSSGLDLAEADRLSSAAPTERLQVCRRGRRAVTQGSPSSQTGIA